jgi:hypothetical protein
MKVYKLHKHTCKPQGSPTPTLWYSQKKGSRSKHYALNNTSIQEEKLLNFHKLSLFLTTKNLHFVVLEV